MPTSQRGVCAAPARPALLRGYVCGLGSTRRPPGSVSLWWPGYSARHARPPSTDRTVTLAAAISARTGRGAPSGTSAPSGGRPGGTRRGPEEQPAPRLHGGGGRSPLAGCSAASSGRQDAPTAHLTPPAWRRRWRTPTPAGKAAKLRSGETAPLPAPLPSRGQAPDAGVPPPCSPELAGRLPRCRPPPRRTPAPSPARTAGLRGRAPYGRRDDRIRPERASAQECGRGAGTRRRPAQRGPGGLRPGRRTDPRSGRLRPAPGDARAPASADRGLDGGRRLHCPDVRGRRGAAPCFGGSLRGALFAPGGPRPSPCPSPPPGLRPHVCPAPHRAPPPPPGAVRALAAAAP